MLRFAGDSGDGMQLTGDRFTSASALFGNDLATLPEFPAEIRAPAGTLAGVSSFQVHISDHDITTPGDAPTVLVAMNPAALRSDLSLLTPGGTVIVNSDAFNERNLGKAGYESNPLEDGSLDGYTVVTAPMTDLTKRACADLGVKPRDAERSKNFFALGLVSWLYSRPVKPHRRLDRRQVRGPRHVIAANKAAFAAGHAFGETAELGASRLMVNPAALEPGTYTNINGNTALSWGLIAASQQAGHPAVLGVLPDHAGQRHPPRAGPAQELRGPHPAGRGRDRRGRGGPRRGLRGPHRRHHHLRAGHGPQGRDGGPGRQPGAAAGGDRHPAGRPVHRPCPPRPRPPTC